MKFTVATVRLHKMSVAIFSPTPYINKWQMSLCNNSSDNKSYWIHRVDVKVSAQVTTVTYMHQSQPSLHSLRNNLTVHLELWPGNHLIWCNTTLRTTGLAYWTVPACNLPEALLRWSDVTYSVVMRSVWITVDRRFMPHQRGVRHAKLQNFMMPWYTCYLFVFRLWSHVCESDVFSSVSAAQFAHLRMFYLTTHSTHFIYGYMASDMSQRTTQVLVTELFETLRILFVWRLTSSTPSWCRTSTTSTYEVDLCA